MAEIRESNYTPVVFFVIMALVVLWALLPHEWSRTLVFWYCNNISLFFAIAFYEDNMQLVKGLSYVGILPQLLWISDFISHLVGFDLANTANYIFVEGFTFSNNVSVILHMTVPIIAILYTFRIRPRPQSLFYSIVFIIGLYVMTLAGTAPADDVNCVFNACLQFSFHYNAIIWPLEMIILALGGYALHEGLYLLFQKYVEWKRGRS